MASYRVLELNLISANDLKKVTLFSRMRVYAVASISGGDPRMPTHCTPADRYGGCSPAWNATFHFPIPSGSDTRGLALHVLLRAERRALIGGSRDVGEVFVPIDDLLVAAAGDGAGKDTARPATYQVRRPRSGRVHGVLYFCYKFIDVPAAGVPSNKEGQYVKYVQDSAATDKQVASPPPATAYPPPQQQTYQPPPYNAGYASQPYPYPAPAPAYGYNAGPPPEMYGYAPPPPPAAARRHGGGGMGMGLGLGLLGGAVGGMMIGDMIGDAEVDAAYDAGFNDGFEF
ncbi:hypothetical protein EJB05_30469, partial [Eragrostis curvula]